MFLGGRKPPWLARKGVSFPPGPPSFPQRALFRRMRRYGNIVAFPAATVPRRHNEFFPCEKDRTRGGREYRPKTGKHKGHSSTSRNGLFARFGAGALTTVARQATRRPLRAAAAMYRGTPARYNQGVSPSSKVKRSKARWGRGWGSGGRGTPSRASRGGTPSPRNFPSPSIQYRRASGGSRASIRAEPSQRRNSSLVQP